MPAFYLTLIAVLLAGIGARDQVTVAGLALRQGPRPGILVVALASAGATAVFATWAATALLAQLPPPARTIFVAIALALAGLESLILRPRRNPREPTHSLGALLLVLLAHQVTDAARFLVFGMGVGFGAPLASGAAGILGGGVLVAFAWGWPHLLDTAAARWTRRGVGGVLSLVALTIFLSEIGIL
ncbi:hypothetical protein [Novosphingobium malaysiense]|uniref:GDT1 family protein n=1 Tax=Novosphingobium malaysiense TaxID=1348853 RepID=A0A0B1ZL66_9SPHN|nr:hypothetical protein [Novosphingobium malaysiense]KHK90010.1 hypothetical protein LK12_19190 [Novosphingobium malaysiense]